MTSQRNSASSSFLITAGALVGSLATIAFQTYVHERRRDKTLERIRSKRSMQLSDYHDDNQTTTTTSSSSSSLSLTETEATIPTNNTTIFNNTKNTINPILPMDMDDETLQEELKRLEDRQSRICVIFTTIDDIGRLRRHHHHHHHHHHDDDGATDDHAIGETMMMEIQDNRCIGPLEIEKGDVEYILDIWHKGRGRRRQLEFPAMEVSSQEEEQVKSPPRRDVPHTAETAEEKEVEQGNQNEPQHLSAPVLRTTEEEKQDNCLNHPSVSQERGAAAPMEVAKKFLVESVKLFTTSDHKRQESAPSTITPEKEQPGNDDALVSPENEESEYDSSWRDLPQVLPDGEDDHHDAHDEKPPRETTAQQHSVADERKANEPRRPLQTSVRPFSLSDLFGKTATVPTVQPGQYIFQEEDFENAAANGGVANDHHYPDHEKHFQYQKVIHVDNINKEKAVASIEEENAKVQDGGDLIHHNNSDHSMSSFLSKISSSPPRHFSISDLFNKQYPPPTSTISSIPEESEEVVGTTANNNSDKLKETAKSIYTAVDIIDSISSGAGSGVKSLDNDKHEAKAATPTTKGGPAKDNGAKKEDSSTRSHPQRLLSKPPSPFKNMSFSDLFGKPKIVPIEEGGQAK